MTFDEFKILHAKYKNIKESKSKWIADEYESYVEAMHDNQEFLDWKLIQDLEEKNFEYKDFCCVFMAHKVSESLNKKGEIKYNDYDVIIHKWNDGTFGIPIHDGGSSIIEINFCPWCGGNLKK